MVTYELEDGVLQVEDLAALHLAEEALTPSSVSSIHVGERLLCALPPASLFQRLGRFSPLREVILSDEWTRADSRALLLDAFRTEFPSVPCRWSHGTEKRWYLSLPEMLQP